MPGCLTPAWNFANRLGGTELTPEAPNSRDVVGEAGMIPIL
jgi:hypothetical protein